MFRSKAKGFTLIELVAALAISLLLTLVTSELVISYFRNTNEFISRTFGQSEVQVLSNHLKFHAENVVRISPPEDLLIAGDKLYGGVVNLTDSMKPPFCEVIYDGNVIRSGGIRLSSVVGRLRSETTLKTWSEVNWATDPIIVDLQVPAVTNSPTALSRVGEEIYVADSISLTRRRYQIRQVEDIVNSDKDPDGNTILDGGGNPILFSFRKVHVDMPKNYSGPNAPNPGVIFPSGAEIYGLTTNVYCKDLTTGDFQVFDEAKNSKKLLLASQFYEIRRIQIAFIPISVLRDRMAQSHVGYIDPFTSAKRLQGITNVLSGNPMNRLCIGAAAVGLQVKDRKQEGTSAQTSLMEQVPEGVSEDYFGPWTNLVLVDMSGNGSAINLTMLRSSYKSGVYQSTRLLQFRDFALDAPVACSVAD